MNLRLDNCEHCAAVTHLCGYTVQTAIDALEAGELGCWLCLDSQDEDGERGHTRCVQLLDDEGAVLWDGRCRQVEGRRA